MNAAATWPEDVSILQDIYEADNGLGWDWKLPLGTNGNKWSFNGNSNRDPCLDNWQGVGCIFLRSDDYYHVSDITLGGYNLKGPIPETIGGLAQLNNLVMGNNHLTGTIPESITQLGQLTQLQLYNNHLHGSISEKIGNLTKLRILYLYDNLLTGTIPESITQLDQLNMLLLYGNLLHGSIPESIGSLIQLNNLNLFENQLTGTIPESITQLGQLTQLQLYNNHLHGSISEKIGNLTKLRILYLSNNQLTGTITENIAQLSQLTQLELYSNNLHGSIPQSIGNLSQLQNLYLSNNQLTGTIPEGITQLGQLTQLQLYINHLHGSIPESIGNLTQLQNLYLSNNQLTGTIPESITQLGQLTKFLLYSNHLHGSIPKSIGNLTQLRYLYLSNNQLTGTIPESLGILKNLIVIYIYSNQLVGTLPASLGQITKLQTLLAFNNYLAGSLPTSLYDLPLLNELYLQENYLTGTVQNFTYPLMQNLFLSSNLLTGPFAPLFQQQRGLVNVQLQDNAFTGSLLKLLPSPGIANATQLPLYPQLTYLDLSGNQVSGSIPEALADHVPHLENLLLTKNCLTGPIPVSLCQLDNLKQLVLGGLHTAEACRTSHRPVYDPFHWLGGYVATPMEGSLPNCVWDLARLQVLDVSGNGLTGKLHYLDTKNASFWANGTALRNITMSYNRLSGSIPLSLQQSGRLVQLDLSYNNLKGSIDAIQYKTNLLVGLDIYNSTNSSLALWAINTSAFSNSFSSLDNVTSSHFRLHVNRLTGVVPASIHEAANVDVLKGNMFSCSFYGQNAPVHDPSYGSYSCGSQTLDATLISAGAALGLFIVVLVSLLVYAYAYPVNRAPRIHLGDWLMTSLQRTLNKVRQVQQSSEHKGLHLFDMWTLRPLKESLKISLQSNDVEDQTMLNDAAPLAGHGSQSAKFSPNCQLSYTSRSFLLIQPSYLQFQRSITLVRVLCLRLCLFTVAVCLPLYLFFNLYRGSGTEGTGDTGGSGSSQTGSGWPPYSTRTEQYGWAATSVFVTGDLPAGLLCGLWLLALYGSLAHVVSFNGSKEDIASKETRISLEDACLSMASEGDNTVMPPRQGIDSIIPLQGSVTRPLLHGLVLAINATVNLSLNIFFVGFIERSSSSAASKNGLTVALSLFKLFWNMTFVKRMVGMLGESSSTTSLVVSGMLVFNMVMAPLLAASLYSSQCFETLLFGSDTISSSHHYQQCLIYTLQGKKNKCVSYLHISYVDSYQPGFIYLYNCTSALLTAYLPVFMVSALLLAVPVPLITLWLAFADAQWLPVWLRLRLPKLLRPQDLSLESVALSHGHVDSLAMFNIQIVLFTNFTLMLTFGLVSPALSGLLALGVVVNSCMWQFLLERYLEYQPAASSQDMRPATMEVDYPPNHNHSQPRHEEEDGLEGFIELKADAEHSSSSHFSTHSLGLDSLTSEKDSMVELVAVSPMHSLQYKQQRPDALEDIHLSPTAAPPESSPGQFQTSNSPPQDTQASINLERSMRVELACAAAWRFLQQSMGVTCLSCLLFYALVFFDMSGDGASGQGGLHHAQWVLGLFGALMALTLAALYWARGHEAPAQPTP